MRGRVGTDIGIKLLPVMWVFLCIPRHIHFYEVQQWYNHTVLYMHITIRPCFLCFFYNPYMSLFNSKNFSFTCPHSFFTCSKQIACLLLLLRQPRSEFPNLRGKIQSVGLCTQYTNEMCAPFCTSPNCSTDSSECSHMQSCLGSGNCSYTVY